jgi:hypothetical protein
MASPCQRLAFLLAPESQARGVGPMEGSCSSIPGELSNAGPFNGHWSTTGGNTFNLIWPKPVDSVTLSPDSHHLSGLNQYGIAISGAKTSAACEGE